MRVVVIGGGIAGVTAAYELRRDGHEVVVLERRGGVALETSFANAGLIAPGHSFTWASPKAPRVMVKSLYTPGQALRVKPSTDPDFWRWSARFLRNCTEERARINTQRKHRLCRYSQERLTQVRSEVGVDDARIDGGVLYVYRSEETFAAGVEHMGILRDGGQQVEVLDRAQVVAQEPSLAGQADLIAGAVFCPEDGSGDAHLFTRGVADHLASRGVEFQFDTAAGGFELVGDRVEGVHTSRGTIRGDAYVLAVGADAARLGRRLGLRLPIYPVKGYSVTLPVGEGHRPPAVGGVDEDNLVAWCPMGDRFRLTSTAEFAGYDTSYTVRDFDAMFAAARALFPDAADYTKPRYWAGLRPMTPEGTPILGPARQRNLHLCLGHGHMGWTMACGTARIVADLVAAETPAIDLAGMRYS